MTRTLVLGAGAIGGVVAAHLARTGEDVAIVDRDAAHVAAIQSAGLTVTGRADFTVRVPAFLPDAYEGPAHEILLATKTLHTTEALAPFVDRLAPDGFVLSMQNGLEESKIAALVGEARTLGAFLTFGAYLEGPGRIVYSGPGTLRIGELDGRVTPRATALARRLSRFHPAAATDNIHGFLWGKLILGAVYFATAVTDRDVVHLIDDRRYRDVLSAVAAEAAAVAAALSIAVEPFDGFDPRALGAQARSAAAESAWAAQAAYWRRGLSARTGVWRDLAIHHRQTEARPILGALLAAAARAGRGAPRVAATLRVIREIEEGRRALSIDNLATIAGAGDAST